MFWNEKHYVNVVKQKEREREREKIRQNWRMLWDIMRRNQLYVLHICLRYKFLTSCTYDCTRGLLNSWCKLWMKLWHKSHQEKCLTHSALDEDSATGAPQLTTHPSGCSARRREGGTSRGWRGGLMPSTGRRSALTPSLTSRLGSVHSFFMHSSFSPRCVSVDGAAQTRWSCCQSRGGVGMNVRRHLGLLMHRVNA